MNSWPRRPFRVAMRRPIRPVLVLAYVTAAAAVVFASSRRAPQPPGPEPLGPAGALCTEALGRFTQDLHRALVDDSTDANVVASPWSVWSSMASFATFCDGSTRAEIVRALGFETDDVTDETLRAGRAELLERMRRADRHVSLDASQAVWVERSLELEAGAAASLRRDSAVDLRRVDFHRRPPLVAEEIAAWIRRSTGGGARVPAAALPPETELVLTDAISLRARWRDPFDARKTRDGTFRRLDGTEVLVPMMSHDLNHGAGGKEDPRFRVVRMFESDERAAATAVELPHRGERTSLVVVVPDLVDGLADVEARLDVSALGTALDEAEPRTVKVVLPRLSLRRNVDLAPALRALGVESAFTDADLGRLFGGPDRGRLVGRVSHGAALDVDEHGVRSWAFTEWVVFAALPEVVEADRPFLVLVRERTSGAVLFLARILDPSA